MIEKKTLVDQIEITRSGILQIRFGLLIVEDGKELATQWHRTTIAPGVDVDAQIAAVNVHLAQMAQAPCPVEETARVKAIAQVVHTPDVVQKFKSTHPVK